MSSTVQEFDFSVNLLTSVLWAFNDAVNLQGLIQFKQDWYEENQTDFWESWVTDVFDIRTANAFGLSVWSTILNLPLFGESNVSPTDYLNFGFEQTSGVGAYNFSNGNFATDATGVFGISLEQKRILLRLRYYQLATRGVIPDINRFLTYLFGPLQIYVLDELDMSITYVLIGNTAVEMLSLFQLFDILPRPSGVGISYVVSGVDSFGFDPVGLNFENGSFGE